MGSLESQGPACQCDQIVWLLFNISHLRQWKFAKHENNGQGGLKILASARLNKTQMTKDFEYFSKSDHTAGCLL